MASSPPAKPAERTGAAERPELQIPDSFHDLVGYYLRIAQEASFQAIRKGAGAEDLKPGWYTLLTIIAENPGLPPSDISRLIGRDRSTLTSTIKLLNARGLISRRRSRADQRSYGVRLTAEGEAMLEKLKRIAHAHDARLDAIVGADKAHFIAILRRIAEELGDENGSPT
ncbi:MAG: MarR family winged helix-turn-helix transcriptional regulator [Bosea sp. (in: a-proteobacteria)]|uniref:MarR family winged helix-turn-helix transcriptional regulator n=1 Tax=Bosea sp. (in: a-proteobacteria) TaxID=1871050 RepID=UPI003F7CC8D9